MAAAELLKAWSHILADRPDLLPTITGTREDVLENVGTSSDEKAQTPHVLEDKFKVYQ